jgi:hypothetical protein
MDTPQQRLQTAFCKNDIAAVRALITENLRSQETNSRAPSPASRHFRSKTSVRAKCSISFSITAPTPTPKANGGPADSGSWIAPPAGLATYLFS